MAKKLAVITIRIEKDLDDWVSDKAKSKKCTKADMLREIISKARREFLC